MKMILSVKFWITLLFSHHVLNLIEDSHCSGSWENLPLEFHKLSINCEGVGVVKRVHTLFGGVHRLATALKEVEEVREEEQEIRDEWEDEEVEENGGLKVEEKRSSHAWVR